jgi:hypothetical protein
MPKSEAVQSALAAVFEDAKAHRCIRLDSEAVTAEFDSAQLNKKQDTGKNPKQQVKSYSWQPMREDKLVAFLNAIIDHVQGAR